MRFSEWAGLSCLCFAPEHKNETPTPSSWCSSKEKLERKPVLERKTSGKKRKTRHSPGLMILQGPEGGFMGSACLVEREKMKIVAWDQEDHNSRPPDTVNLNHLFIRPPPSSSSIPSSHGIRWRQVGGGWDIPARQQEDSWWSVCWECRSKWGDERRHNPRCFLGGRVRMEERCYRA